MSSIKDEINKIRIIDGHEHLATPQIRKNENQDFFSLLHYLESDLTTAGMPRGALRRERGLAEEDKAAIFLHYWEKSNNTTYARMFRTAMEDLYQLQEWSVQGILTANTKVLEASHNPNWYNKILVEKAGIDLAFTLIQTTKLDYDRFRPIMFFDFTFRLHSFTDIQWVEKYTPIPVEGFRSYLDAVDALLQRYIQEGMVAVKLGHAYWRSLRSDKPTFSEAELIFNRLLRNKQDGELSQGALLPLQDYIIHYLIQRSINYHLPIQIHTGHLEPSVSNNGNNMTNANVEGLIPLLLEYPNAKFVLLHAGYPYDHVFLSIAKNYPNVYPDLTWIYIISPTAAKLVLHQMIEMVPSNKIQGFGGDYNYIEGTYAHQKLARTIVGEVLTEKLHEGAIGEREAIELAKRIFRSNLIDLYQLEGMKD